MNDSVSRSDWRSLIGLALVAGDAAEAQEPAREAEGEQFFADKIEPLLKAHCLECHSHAADEMEGGLTLDSRSGWAEGGGRGPAIVPGKPEESLLIKAVRREDSNLQMPPDEKLHGRKHRTARRMDPTRGSRSQKHVAVSSRRRSAGLVVIASLIRPVVPGAADGKLNPIDAFVLQQLRSSRI